ncbi:hypothetical protein FA13DRAFT_1731725 [Coprinellus micaceus]|uniref:Secreted protein n=1 Tax=Coprinellus micaceus TaxID=71717 RepID=A0A4Y7TG32_COPMI|nr:hypothetical protein FA13DRAFT_1731725 [Coprinellus micaceus]
MQYICAAFCGWLVSSLPLSVFLELSLVVPPLLSTISIDDSFHLNFGCLALSLRHPLVMTRTSKEKRQSPLPLSQRNSRRYDKNLE